ncbi:hypothetical protein AMJ39_08650 [candidate division TA06 bacterium DG_24]|jgi:hypothetical protein|uniref:DUF4064 domain-containing protein n=3 Tax=Bacteria division TA06 TaxID=1156500 RepID=A0A0S8JID1_UNCT6|nr:MAG: hypothetical protein AMJ39_08650 [candidate division TA06 bacterium DG_24]KPK68718.1 MAG: hypothetical protein AMJ82_07540 [candidate division TA06 bacterium SM23_40]KPL08588.1 MAG: hypothetical protein AMJ71_08045 [candidate division TA06 bacterium SM1_40]
MEQHVKVVAVLDLVVGGIQLLSTVLAAFILMLMGSGLFFYCEDEVPPLLALVPLLVLLVSWLLVTGCAWIIAGIGLLRLRPWSRVLQIVLAILSLLWFPLGTAFGIYCLWVTLSAEGAALFSRAGEAGS